MKCYDPNHITTREGLVSSYTEFDLSPSAEEISAAEVTDTQNTNEV